MNSVVISGSLHQFCVCLCMILSPHACSPFVPFFLMLYLSLFNNILDLVQPGSHRLCSIRRRCLVFETSGAHKNKPICDSNSSSPAIPSDCEVFSNEKQAQINTASGYSSTMLPGIGLHLNALATAPTDNKVVKLESPAFRSKQIIMLNSMVSCNPLTPGQNPLDKSLTLKTLEGELAPHYNEAQVTENAPQTSTSAVNEEFDQSSPRRKRHV